MKSALCLSLRLVAIGVALGTAQIVSADSPKAPPFKAIETPEGLEFATVVATDPPYLADSTGQNDATVAIQKAIVDVWRYKGGTVYLPAGKYKILGNLTINPTVTLKGVWEKPTPGQSFGGTILMAYAGRGDANGKPFLQSGLPKDGEAMNLTIWYPEQKPDDIQPYPWTLQGRVSTFRNITLINSYQGIQMIDNSAGVVGDIYGTVLNTGIALMHGSEFPIAYNIDFDSHYWLDD